ncbi:hypothetical protein D3C71_1646660 [compost metagenome]
MCRLTITGDCDDVELGGNLLISLLPLQDDADVEPEFVQASHLSLEVLPVTVLQDIVAMLVQTFAVQEQVNHFV